MTTNPRNPSKPLSALISEQWRILLEARRHELFLRFSPIEVLLDQMIDLCITMAHELFTGFDFFKDRNPIPLGVEQEFNRAYDDPIDKYDFVGNRVMKLYSPRHFEQPNVKDSESFYQLAEELIEYRKSRQAKISSLMLSRAPEFKKSNARCQKVNRQTNKDYHVRRRRSRNDRST